MTVSSLPSISLSWGQKVDGCKYVHGANSVSGYGVDWGGGRLREGESRKVLPFSLIYWAILVCIDNRTPTRKHDHPRSRIHSAQH